MIVELESGRFLAVHIPSAPAGPGAEFDTYLGAKCYMIVNDDRHGTRGWASNFDVLYQASAIDAARAA